MNCRIQVGQKFARELKWLGKRYHSIKRDYAALLDELTANPRTGVDLGGGVRKVRMAIADKHRGKSHGARVITYLYEVDEENGVLSLLTVYDKAERESIGRQEIEALLGELKEEEI
ncbi:MAG: hypothetical protein NC388_07370 [Clostridium sp.]|nr:hypothetical protein [Clostridium sp.]